MDSIPDLPRKQRTRAHVIEEMSLNFLERKVLGRGFQLVRAPSREYGWDATMFHFSPTGEIENGEVRYQLKSTDHLTRDERCVVCRVKCSDLYHWYWEDHRFPFVLVVYDATTERAFWLHVRPWIEENLPKLNVDQETSRVQIPVGNRVTLRTIDRFRQMSLDHFRQVH